MNNQTITKLILAILLCLLADMFCFPATLDAQKMLDPVINPKLYKTEIIHPDQGLSAPFIQCIYEDRYGFIWIGTQYGLDRYDGYSMTRMSDVVSEGVSTSMEWIWSIQEDLEGTLWVCSSKGLFRYDRTMDSFEMLLPNLEETASPDNNVYAIRQDSRSTCWLFTGGGLFSYDGKVNMFKDYKKDSILTDETILSWDNIYWWNQMRFCEDHSGTVWIGTLDGLKKYDHQNDRFITFDNDPDGPQSISGDAIHCITEDKFGTLWVSAYSTTNQRDELYKIIDRENGVIKRYFHDETDPKSLVSGNYIWPIHCDRDSNLWIGGNNGFSKYNYETDDFSNYMLPIIANQTGIIGNSLIPHIMEDSKGNLWMIWFNRGLISFNPSSEEIFHYSYDPGNPDNMVPERRITTVLEDRSGSVWASGQLRISRSDPLFKPFYTTMTSEILNLDSESDVTVNAIHYDKKGTLWFGGDYGLYKSSDFVPGGQNEFTHITGFWPYCFLRDHRGQLWIGTNSWGLGKINEQTNAIKWYRWHQDHPDSLSNDYITMMYEDQRDLFWIAPFRSGLNIFHPEHESFISIEYDPEDQEGLVSHEIWSINEDQHGNMWFGSTYGLSKLEVSQGLTDSIGAVFTGELEQVHLSFRFRNFSNNPFDPYSLSGNMVIDMYNDASGRLWIGTTSGLNLYNEIDENFHVFTEANGLPDNCIFGILEDDHGNLWLSTRKGICKVVMKDGTGPDLIISVQSYRKDDGLQGDIFYENTCHKTDDGWMGFGGNHGFTVFHPDSIKDNYLVPPVYITDIHINNESVYSPEYSILETGLNETDKIELPYKQNFLAFEYLALNYSNAPQNQYKYMMEGLDEDWVEAGTRRYAEYRDLKPGSYTFRVIGSNDDGIWNEEGVAIGIVINPPWYRTILAYFMYVIVLVLLVFGYVRRRTYMLKRENVRLDTLVKKRTKVIEVQKEEIMATNTELEEQKEEIMATNTELEEQKEEIIATNAELEEQKGKIMATNSQLEEQKEELEQQKEELEQQKEELQITLDRLKETQAQLIQSEKLAALGGLVAGVAHEINTPVGISVTAASSLMEESQKMAEKYKENKISRAEFKDYLNDANQSAKLILSNMQRTAEMVQSFKQVSVDQSTSQKRKFMLKSYTQDVIRSLYPRLKKRKVKINLDIDEKIEMDSYPGAFSQIITNLVLNSLIHGFEEEEEGHIDISAEKKNGQLNIEYKDTGKGIEAASLDHIFEPFYTTNKKTGTGLGLHIVYNLVTQKLMGSISCESKIDTGTKFIIEIP